MAKHKTEGFFFSFCFVCFWFFAVIVKLLYLLPTSELSQLLVTLPWATVPNLTETPSLQMPFYSQDPPN